MEIIATFVPSGRRAPHEEIRAVPTAATAVEVRADLLPAGSDLDDLVAASPLPVVLTLRSRAEGGEGPDEPGERRRFFETAAGSTAMLVDLEAARDLPLLGAVVPAERAIVSAHFPGGVPADLEERARTVLSSGARFAKIAPAVRSLADLLAVLRLAGGFDRGPAARRRLVVLATGEAGRAVRMLGPLLAAPLAYAAWAPGRTGAAGQYLPEELLALVGHLQGRPRRLFAVLGNPAGGSLSPLMHTAAYRALALPNIFVPIEIGNAEELDALLGPLGETALDDVGLAAGGYAVTMPWKEEAARRCDVLAPRARRARAANTVLPRPARVLGDCTDIDGVTRVLGEAGLDLAGARVVVLGTGAAARAAVVGLDLAGARVMIAGRDRARADTTAKALGVLAGDAADSGRADAVVNATPAGREGESAPLLEALGLREGAIAVDLPYGGAPTFLETLAGRRGWIYVSGRDVLLFQGVSQFAAMNGVAPPVRAMAAALGLEEERE